jgi:hypothetical protein
MTGIEIISKDICNGLDQVKSINSALSQITKLQNSLNAARNSRPPSALSYPHTNHHNSSPPPTALNNGQTAVPPSGSAITTVVTSGTFHQTLAIESLQENQNELHYIFDGMKSCLSNIKDTHSFMLMTINRCIDYTKATNGLKLVPKYETID